MAASFTTHNLTSNGLVFSGNAEETNTDQSIQLVFFLLYLKRRHSETFKIRSYKKTFLQCMLLVQLASINAFYTMWWLEGIIFCKSLSLMLCFFIRTVAAFFEMIVLKEVRFCVISTRILLIPKFQDKDVLNLMLLDFILNTLFLKNGFYNKRKVLDIPLPQFLRIHQWIGKNMFSISINEILSSLGILGILIGYFGYVRSCLNTSGDD